MIAFVTAASCFLVLTSVAHAEAPNFLTRMPTAGQPGSGAGEADNPRGVAVSPVTGHVYVSDLDNARINEYTAWGLFVKSWGWGVEDGSSELQTCGPSEPEETPSPSLCRSGLAGGSAGQISLPLGLALDSTGDVYVFELGNFRVQKFSSEGAFELMFGGQVNKTKVEGGAPATQQNVCPIDPGDVCQAGTAGSDPGELSSTVRNVIAYSPVGGGAIVVGDKDRIQIFNLDGTYREEIPFTGALVAFADKPVSGLDIDFAGNIYFSVVGEEDVFKISAAGMPLAPGKPGESKFDAKVPLGVAIDHSGNVYIIDDPAEGFAQARVAKFDPSGTKLVPTESEEAEDRFFPYVPFQGPALNGIAASICPGSAEPGNLYLSFFRFGKVAHVDAYGTAPVGCEPPPPRPPAIVEQYATSVGSDSAVVQARINPRFWSDTTYYVEYGKGSCAEEGCPFKVPVSPAVLTELSVNKAVATAGVALLGLQPNTTYHFRFVAESSGGGPIFGQDPDGAGPAEPLVQTGLEGKFRTFNTSGSSHVCSNDAFRSGPGAQLPDCRAYEMVSPLDKEGGDVARWEGKNAQFPLFFELNQSAPSGERFAFTSAYAFAEAEAAPFVSQYLAERTAGGWGGRAISPPRTELPVNTIAAFGNEFQGFSPDLCRAWVFHLSVETLSPGAISEYPNLYRRDNCTESPRYEALTTAKPDDRAPDEYLRVRMLGASADGSHTIFVANGALLPPQTPSLPDFLEQLLYERTPDGLRFVCYLPNGKPSPQACGAGMPGSTDIRSSVRNAISADGSRIFWTAHGGGSSSRQLYLRIAGTETVAVSGAVAPDPASYWTAADDGSKAIFSFDSGPHKDELYEFNVDSEEATLIAKGVEGPMGASDNASRLYFASTEDLDDAGPGSKGAHNLYFYEADPGGGLGAFVFVMALADADIGGSNAAPAPIDEAPNQRTARVTSDGLHMTFSSVSPPPSGYDNRSAESGIPAQEVYRYDAETGDLRCISCNPTGARPAGELLETFPAAAQIQGWEMHQHAPRVISEDGSRVFFESFEALVPRDTNGSWDVYQWEEPGKGTCDEGDPTFGTEAGGCVELISSGESPAKSTFLDADPSGDNVFFSTQSSLVGQDYGLNDVYVARVGGGFPEPEKKPICEGDACQGPSAAPVPLTPSSSTYRGPEAVKRLCPKGKRRVKRAGKVRCAKKRRKGAKARKRSRARASR